MITFSDRYKEITEHTTPDGSVIRITAPVRIRDRVGDRPDALLFYADALLLYGIENDCLVRK